MKRTPKRPPTPKKRPRVRARKLAVTRPRKVEAAPKAKAKPKAAKAPVRVQTPVRVQAQPEIVRPRPALTVVPPRREVVAQNHRFRVGETLQFTPSAFDRSAVRGLYEVVRLLPAESLGHQYRVRCVADGHERVVSESQLA